MQFKVRVFQRQTTAVWATRNQHKLIGFLMGVCMTSGHDVERAAQIASDAFNEAMIPGRTYQGTHFLVWQGEGTDFDPVEGSRDELTCPDHPDRIKEWDGTALVCAGCILNAPAAKSEDVEPSECALCHQPIADHVGSICENSVDV